MSRDYADGDVIFDTQWIALKNAMNGNGVLDPAPTLTPGGLMDIDIGAADVTRAKTKVSITPGNVTFTVVTAKTKWGAIWVPASGVPYMKMGAEADKPIMPEPNSWDDILLGGVLITLGMTTITAPDIIEMYFITMLQDHIQDTANPHGVTYTQAGAEQAFSKNSAFNKNFGTIAGTTCQGNDSRLSDSRTPTAHGHSLHTNRTRRIFYSATAFEKISGASYVEKTGGPGAYVCNGIKLTGAGNERLGGNISIPGDIAATSEVFTISVVYIYEVGGAGRTCSTQMDTIQIIPDYTQGQNTYGLTTYPNCPMPVAPPAIKYLEQTIFSITSTLTSFKNISFLFANTDVYDLYILGFIVEYVADM